MVLLAPPSVRTRRFTVDEYHRMIAAGVLGKYHPVELIDGEIVYRADFRLPEFHGTPTPERYGFTADECRRLIELGLVDANEDVERAGPEVRPNVSIGDPHCVCVDNLNELLMPRAVAAARIRVQNPIALSDSDPQPDICLVRRRPDKYIGGRPHAADVLLLIEVADSSLAYDRDVKGPRYAADGIADFWIVDLNTDTVLVHRDPTTTGYATVTTHARGDILTPLALPTVAIAVDEILP